ncbi:hypothetical protein [Aequorivita capsosiphonis]|uniref:hypothetical protein n=1 Tax=Aequorivita capsosiphonis TaxID=487317 RepID=UPI00047D1D9B|nr:hypothetical protein [Aequorivita capsosiphonis]
MKTIVFALAVALCLSSCHAQEKKGDADNSTAMKTQTEIQKESHGTRKVNKEVDENGNLVRYDSIYNYSYGDINGKQVSPEKTDSLMASFQKYMQDRMPGFSQEMMNPLKSDSLHADFYQNDFFLNHWEDFFPGMKNQLKEMDSLHQGFFQQTQPGLFPPEEKKN